MSHFTRDNAEIQTSSNGRLIDTTLPESNHIEKMLAQSYQENRCEIGDAGEFGLGVFATANIPKHSKKNPSAITEYRGTLITPYNFEGIKSHVYKIPGILFGIDGYNVSLECRLALAYNDVKMPRALGAMCNSARGRSFLKPNAKFIVVRSQTNTENAQKNEVFVFIVAKREINQGEEIVLNYTLPS